MHKEKVKAAGVTAALGSTSADERQLSSASIAQTRVKSKEQSFAVLQKLAAPGG